MTAEEFAECARQTARRTAVEQGFTEIVTDLETVRNLRELMRKTYNPIE